MKKFDNYFYFGIISASKIDGMPCIRGLIWLWKGVKNFVYRVIGSVVAQIREDWGVPSNVRSTTGPFLLAQVKIYNDGEQIMATFTIKEKAKGILAGNSWDIFTSFKKLAYADQTSLWVMGFNAENVEIMRECVQTGGIKDLYADISLVLRRVLMSGATAFACIYNRVSGVSAPKEGDSRFVHALFNASELIKITFFDCIIVASDGYFSFRDHDWQQTCGQDSILPVHIMSEKVLNINNFRETGV